MSIETENLHWPLWKSGNMVLNLRKLVVQNIQITNPLPRAGVSAFLSVNWNRKFASPIMKKWEKIVLNSCKLVTQKNSNFQLSQSLSLHCVDRNRKLTLAFMKNWKNGSQFVEASHTGYYSWMLVLNQGFQFTLESVLCFLIFNFCGHLPHNH